MASGPKLKRGHTVSFDSKYNTSVDSVEEERSTAVSPQRTPPLRPRLRTEPSTHSADQEEQPDPQTHGEVLWQIIKTEHRNLLEGETYHAHCSASVAISNRSGAQRTRARRYSFSSGYHKVEVFVTGYSLHFFKQRRAVTFNGVFEIFEVYRSLPLMSLQDAAILEREGQHHYLLLVFQRNEVKAKFSDEDSASELHRIIMANREECMVRARQQHSHLLPGSSSSAGLQQFHSLSVASARRADKRAAQDLPSHRWLDNLFVTLRLRPQEVYQPLENQGDICFRSGRWKHLESERSIIKYPSPGSALVLPTECYFRMDDVHVALLWKSPTEKHYRRKKCITLDQVVEVRRGQQTEGFGKFPYRATERHSLSFMFETEKTVRASIFFNANRYVTLQSIDIVCETSKEAEDWIDAISEYHFDTGKKLFPKKLKYLDHTLIWLKTHFSVLGTHYGEISLDKVSKFYRAIKSDVNSIDIHKWFLFAKSCMQHDTTLSGALTWKGFVSVYDHFVDTEAKRLLAMFRMFAREEPEVGMTVAEFRRFLIEDQKWSEESCSERECRKLMDRYGQHHSLYKERVARGAGKSSPLQLSLYLSFPGFMSFVRGKDNQIIDPLHEEVYQDMTRPLAHYLINSSHNTFLEGHQLRGNSSYDAYIRPLLHGVRCLEIDCWDDEVGGIVVTHGNTPTTRLSFARVLKTIKEYAFVASEYPLILSLENHCKKDNRKRMAKLLEEEFGDHLVREDMEAWQRRAHLPSPTDLKHKILLKDSFRYQKKDQNGEAPSSPEEQPLPTASSSQPCPPQPTSPQLRPTGHSLPTLSLPPGMSLSTSPPPPALVCGSTQSLSRNGRGFTESLGRGGRGFTESLGRGGHGAVTFDIPEDDKQDRFHKPKPKRQAHTFHGLGHRSSDKRPVFVGPSHLALDIGSTAPEPAPAEEEAETDGPTMDSLQPFAWNFLARFSRVDEEEAKEKLERQTEEEHISHEKEMAQELTNLVYLQSQKIKPGQLWAEAHNLQPFQMLSFKETKAMEHCREKPGDLLQLGTRCLLRVYPKGSRIASENYDPTPLWNYGVQLVALNHQTPDMCLHINQGRFRQNGSCGYILKPACLQERLPADLNSAPHTAVHTEAGEVINLEVKFVSAQNLSPPNTNLEFFKIWVALSGIEHDSTSNLEPFRKLNCDVPPLFEGRGQDTAVSFFDFPENAKLSHPLLYSEMCMLYVRVEIQAVRSMGRRPTTVVYGQNAIPVDSLREGLRFLPLRDVSGHLIHQSGFFVHICKTVLKPDRRGSIIQLQTTLSSDHENGDVDTSQGVQNGDRLHHRSEHTQSNGTSHKSRQNRFSRQESIEEGAMSSQVVVVELH